MCIAACHCLICNVGLILGKRQGVLDFGEPLVSVQILVDFLLDKAGICEGDCCLIESVLLLHPLYCFIQSQNVVDAIGKLFIIKGSVRSTVYGIIQITL